MTHTPELAFGIVANVISDRVLRTGAKVWIHRWNGDAEHPIVSGCSKSGRVIQKYTDFKRLENYRAAWIPEHMRDRVCGWETKEEADALASKLGKMWAGIRHFSRDGSTLMRDGATTSEAFRRIV